MTDREHFIATLQACYWGDKGAYNHVVEIYDNMQRRIDKAFEYIREETTRFTEAYVEDDGRINLGKSKYKIVNLSPTKVKKLLNILKGDDTNVE